MNRHGFTVLELLIAIGLMAFLGIVSQRLFVASFRTMQTARSADTSITRFDHAMRRLRADTWSSTQISAEGLSATLQQIDGKSIAWRFTDSGDLIRTDGATTLTWPDVCAWRDSPPRVQVSPFISPTVSPNVPAASNSSASSNLPVEVHHENAAQWICGAYCNRTVFHHRHGHRRRGDAVRDRGAPIAGAEAADAQIRQLLLAGQTMAPQALQGWNGQPQQTFFMTLPKELEREDARLSFTATTVDAGVEVVVDATLGKRHGWQTLKFTKTAEGLKLIGATLNG